MYVRLNIVRYIHRDVKIRYYIWIYMFKNKKRLNYNNQKGLQKINFKKNLMNKTGMSLEKDKRFNGCNTLCGEVRSI